MKGSLITGLMQQIRVNDTKIEAVLLRDCRVLFLPYGEMLTDFKCGEDRKEQLEYGKEFIGEVLDEDFTREYESESGEYSERLLLPYMTAESIYNYLVKNDLEGKDIDKIFVSREMSDIICVCK